MGRMTREISNADVTIGAGDALPPLTEFSYIRTGIPPEEQCADYIRARRYYKPIKARIDALRSLSRTCTIALCASTAILITMAMQKKGEEEMKVAAGGMAAITATIRGFARRRIEKLKDQSHELCMIVRGFEQEKLSPGGAEFMKQLGIDFDPNTYPYDPTFENYGGSRTTIEGNAARIATNIGEGAEVCLSLARELI